MCFSLALSHHVPAALFVLALQMFTCLWLNLSSHGALFPPGLLLMVGLMLYPAGWGSEKVHSYCGPEALPFRPALCSLGWAFYAAIGGTLASFLCAVLSAQAEIATSSDKVQEEIEEGKSLICVLWNTEINALQWTKVDADIGLKGLLWNVKNNTFNLTYDQNVYNFILTRFLASVKNVVRKIVIHIALQYVLTVILDN